MGSPAHGASNKLLPLRSLVPVKSWLRVTSHGHTVIRCEGGLMLRCVPRVDHLGHPDGACTFTVALWSHMLRGLALWRAGSLGEI